MLTADHGTSKHSRAPRVLCRGSRATTARWLALGAIALVSFLLTLEDTAVGIALTSIRRDLGVGMTGLEWIVNAYTLALAVLVLPAGKLADAHGRRRVFLLGVCVFTASSALAGLADGGPMLIAARLIQGAGAAFAGSAALSIVSVMFPKPERGAALGIWASASAVGLAVGPVLGAIIVKLLGWPWVFLVNVPLGVIALAVAWLLVPESSAGAGERRLPWTAVGLWAAMLLGLVMAFTEAGSSNWSSPQVLGPGVAAGLLLVAFAWHEQRSVARLIGRELAHSRNTVGANVVSLMSTAVMCNLFVFIGMYLQIVLVYGTVTAGIALLPLTAAIVMMAPVAGRLSDRIGRRLPVSIGLLLLATGLTTLSALSVRTDQLLIFAGLGLSGLGIGLTASPTTAAALDTSGSDAAGEAAGLLNTSRMIGLSLGVATMGAIVSASGNVLAGGMRAHEAFVAGLSTALRLNAGVAVLAALIALATLRSVTLPAPKPTGRRSWGRHRDTGAARGSGRNYANGTEGKVTVKREPSPGLLSTSIRPLWARTSSATIARPIPAPPVALARERSPRQNRSKM